MKEKMVEKMDEKSEDQSLTEKLVPEKKFFQKKSFIITIIIAGAVIVGAAIALVLILVKGSSTPPVPPIPPPTPIEYYVRSITETASSLKADIEENSTTLFFQNNSLSPYIKNLTFEANFESENELSIIITDKVKKRFTMPYARPFPFTKAPKSKSLTKNLYNVFITEKGSLFGFTVKRENTNEEVWKSKCVDFVYSDKYISFGTCTPSKFIYGLGERASNFLLQKGNYTIWAYGHNVGTADPGIPGNQLYGQHPVYLMREESGNWHMVYLRNMNAMDIIYNETHLQYKMVGGLIELKFFFCGKIPEDCIKNYHLYVNKHKPFPFWSYGFHQSKWGYGSSKLLLEKLKKFDENKLPIDTIWSDIDYMNNYESFSIDKTQFKIDEIQQIFQQKRYWIIIIDPGIKFPSKLFDLGDANTTFIKSQKTNKSLINCVWPGKTAFVDYNNRNASFFWQYAFNSFFNEIKPIRPSGIWLDMNEFCVFKKAEVPDTDLCQYNFNMQKTIKSKKILSPSEKKNIFSINEEQTWADRLPYSPGNGSLDKRSISLDALHFGNGVYMNCGDNCWEWDFHGINGILEVIETQYFLTLAGFTFPFILTRNTMPGSGAYAAHWTGDNEASWDFLRFFQCVGFCIDIDNGNEKSSNLFLLFNLFTNLRFFRKFVVLLFEKTILVLLFYIQFVDSLLKIEWNN